MTMYSYTSFMSSPVSVHVAERITCAVVGPPGEWKGRVRFPRWSLIDDARRTSLEDRQLQATIERRRITDGMINIYLNPLFSTSSGHRTFFTSRCPYILIRLQCLHMPASP
ncbi:hypothetical protein L3Y34_017342 [Caenorhabditis briggsae]|uniref:Uncharacterized protein n=1 Tax=Caenorhabditis briggsae TaxID=6238 RepID=A0AAE9DI67_CAEBR|nr:hypothetical protein L3Y34_017342 [Caenorhabditis briggsae]